MEDNSKDAEVRARVPSEMHSALSEIARGRGEQLPVILREALSEYLARRAASAAGKYPEPGAEALMQILRDQPDVAKTLIAIGNMLKPINSSPGLAGAKQIVSAAGAHALGATTAPPPPTKPVKHTTARNSKKQPKP